MATRYTPHEQVKRLLICAKVRLAHASNKLTLLNKVSSRIEVCTAIESFETRLQHFDEVQAKVESFNSDTTESSSGDFRDNKLMPWFRARELLATKNITLQLQANLLRLQLPVLTRGYIYGHTETFKDEESLQPTVSVNHSHGHPGAESRVLQPDVKAAVVQRAPNVLHGDFVENVSTPDRQFVENVSTSDRDFVENVSTPEFVENISQPAASRSVVSKTQVTPSEPRQPDVTHDFVKTTHTVSCHLQTSAQRAPEDTLSQVIRASWIRRWCAR